MKMPSNEPPPHDSRELSRHFSDTYFSLRFGLAALAFAMPVVMYAYGKFRHGLDLQPSLSAYFWAAAGDQCATFPMRTLFVGFLFAIGISLYVYKGLTTLENWLLNAAAVCAAVVAIFPERLSLTDAPRDERLTQLFAACPAVKAWAMEPSVPLHYVAAVTLFVLLAIIAWFCANKSLDYLPPGNDAKKFKRTYRILAIAMILFPVAGLAVGLVLGMGYSVFFIEALGIWTFGTYWLVKSRELALSRLEKDPDHAVAHAKERKSTGQLA